MAQRRHRVLIVDDEDGIVLALHRFLYQDNHRYDVLLAKNAEIGRQILRETPIDILVTDVHLPGMSGMDLVCWAAVETPDTRAIVMTAFDVATIRDKAHAVGCLKLMRKPFDLHELRAAILQAMETRDSLLGSLSELSAVDVIQMLCLGRKTTALRIARGQSSGVILIHNGDIVHAVWDNIVGEEAVHEMIAVEDGVFNMAPFPPDFERTINGDYQHILMEGVRKLDEKARDNPGDDEPRPSVRPGRLQMGGGASKDDGWGFDSEPVFTQQQRSPAVTTNARMRLDTLIPAAPPPPRMDPPRAAPEPQRAPEPPPPPPEPVESPEEIRAREKEREVASLMDKGFQALRSGNRDEARKFWQQALELDPGNRRVELNLKKLDQDPNKRY